jgi:lactoylglutathione lyase
MPITRIQSTTICVSDQERALDFYVNKLGFEKREDAPFGLDSTLRWIEVAPPGADSVLVLAKGYGGCEPGRLGKFAGVVLYADDIASTYDELKARGVKFTEAPFKQSWGMMQAQFLDQDGNGLVLVGK